MHVSHSDFQSELDDRFLELEERLERLVGRRVHITILTAVEGQPDVCVAANIDEHVIARLVTEWLAQRPHLQ